MSLFLHQLRGEQRLYWRSRELAFFTFLFPIVLFILLGSVYGSDRIKSEHNVKSSSYLLAGVLGYGVASTAFAGLAIVLVLRRESGILKRLRATPLPPAVYLAGVIASTVLVFAVEAATLIVLGRVMFDVPFPEHWASVILSLLLGALTFAALGIALSGAIVFYVDWSSKVAFAEFLATSQQTTGSNPVIHPMTLQGRCERGAMARLHGSA